jgi:2-dehydro-3-deoxygluconokinase
VGALGLAGTHPGDVRLSADEIPDALVEAADRAPNAPVVATTLREVSSADVNDWSSAAWSAETAFVTGPRTRGLHVLDRVGSGDGFAAGLIHGLLTGASLDRRAGPAGPGAADPAR